MTVKRNAAGVPREHFGAMLKILQLAGDLATGLHC